MSTFTIVRVFNSKEGAYEYKRLINGKTYKEYLDLDDRDTLRIRMAMMAKEMQANISK
jgi:hypothetical protein